jgi:acyl-CoA hydrolase
LVISEDLNHHGTLFAGKAAAWFVEAGFIAASSLTSSDSTVCLKIHGMLFTKPIKRGSIIRIESKIVLTKRTSMVAYVTVMLHPSEEFLVDGFLTFIHVDEQGRPIPHGIIIEAESSENIALQEKAKFL